MNRNDHHTSREYGTYGVGHQVLSKSGFDETEVSIALALLDRRRSHFGDGAFAIDAGANIGVHSIEWARHMHGWGHVLAFEAQEVIFYALAGNVALNNCLNARVRLAALGAQCGEIVVPQPDYLQPASFGSLELRQRPSSEFIGQVVSADEKTGAKVPLVSVDSLDLERLDLIKIDVEGMEIEVLRGAASAIARHHPILIIEVIKSDRAEIEAWLLEFGYQSFPGGPNIIAVHSSDPTLREIEADGEWVRVSV